MKALGTRSGANGTPAVRILFVGGDTYVSQVPIRFLISCGFEVTAAGSGDEGWALVEAGKHQFAFVIIDHDIPSFGEMDGIGIVTKLRSVCYPGGVIVLSANGNSAEFESYNRLGVVEILAKPVTLWRLGQSIAAQTATL